MSVEQSDVVDLIGIDTASGAVHLTIADHLPWSKEHLFKLQEKLSHYLAFIESGEIFEVYPRAVGQELVIHAVLQHRPVAEASAFLKQCSRAIAEAGFTFKYGPPQGGYAGDDA